MVLQTRCLPHVDLKRFVYVNIMMEFEIMLIGEQQESPSKRGLNLAIFSNGPNT